MLRWIMITNTELPETPEWQRSAAIETDDGEVFIPAAFAGPELLALLCATADGEDALADDGHIYLSAKWMAREYPDLADTCETIERKCREHLKKTGDPGEPPAVG